MVKQVLLFMVALMLMGVGGATAPVPAQTAALTVVGGANYATASLHYDCAQLTVVTAAMQETDGDYFLSFQVPSFCTPTAQDDCQGAYYPEYDVVFGTCGGEHVEAAFWAWDVDLEEPRYELAVTGLAYWVDPCTQIDVGPVQVVTPDELQEMLPPQCLVGASFFGFRDVFVAQPDLSPLSPVWDLIGP